MSQQISSTSFHFIIHYHVAFLCGVVWVTCSVVKWITSKSPVEFLCFQDKEGVNVKLRGQNFDKIQSSIERVKKYCLNVYCSTFINMDELFVFRNGFGIVMKCLISHHFC
jgi:hypothetical protein